MRLRLRRAVCGADRIRNQRTKPQRHSRTQTRPSASGNQFASGTRSDQMAAAVSQSQSFNFGPGQEKLFVSRATIKLQLPPSPGLPRVYEYRTQVSPLQPAQDSECVKEQQRRTEAAATPNGNYYTPPRISGTEAKRKNLPQTLSNFFEAERYASASNRVKQ